MPMKEAFEYNLTNPVYKPYETPMPFTEGLYMDLKNYIETLEKRIEELESTIKTLKNKGNTVINIESPDIVPNPKVWWDTKSPFTINSPTC